MIKSVPCILFYRHRESAMPLRNSDIRKRGSRGVPATITAFLRAISNIVSVMSMPITWPVGPTRRDCLETVDPASRSDVQDGFAGAHGFQPCGCAAAIGNFEDLFGDEGLEVAHVDSWSDNTCVHPSWPPGRIDR
jgi:hypothetical protein